MASPDEIIFTVEKMKVMKVKITRRTLLNYEIAHLIPEPKRGGGGPGGKFTDYPYGTAEEVYAAWSMLHGKYGSILSGNANKSVAWLPDLSPDIVATARIMAHRVYLELNNQLTDENFSKSLPYSNIDPTEIDGKVFLTRANDIFNQTIEDYNGRFGISISRTIMTFDYLCEAIAWNSSLSFYTLIHLLQCVQAAKIISNNEKVR